MRQNSIKFIILLAMPNSPSTPKKQCQTLHKCTKRRKKEKEKAYIVHLFLYFEKGSLKNYNINET